MTFNSLCIKLILEGSGDLEMTILLCLGPGIDNRGQWRPPSCICWPHTERDREFGPRGRTRVSRKKPQAV
jgi:hypothetical protein